MFDKAWSRRSNGRTDDMKQDLRRAEQPNLEGGRADLRPCRRVPTARRGARERKTHERHSSARPMGRVGYMAVPPGPASSPTAGGAAGRRRRHVTPQCLLLGLAFDSLILGFHVLAAAAAAAVVGTFARSVVIGAIEIARHVSGSHSRTLSSR